ncbi:MAG: hypothetical protein ACOX5F_10015 [Anaerovoracaceae bacterium]|jgi:hypothetical protein
MEMTTEDYLKKALLDTQEKVRDFKAYAGRIDDDEIKTFFREQAVVEGLQARKLQEFINNLE